MAKCCVNYCSSNLFKENIKLHPFPSEAHQLKAWLKFCGNEITSEERYICSKHFEKNDYAIVLMLKTSAIPSKFNSNDCLRLSNKRPSKKKDDGSVILPKKTKSGRVVNPPSVYQNNSEEEEEDQGNLKNNKEILEESEESSHPEYISEYEELINMLSKNYELDIMNENNLIKENLSPLTEIPPNLKDTEISKELQKHYEQKLQKETQKLKEERRRRKHMEKLLGASMQKQKATELKAQVTEEFLKVYCPMRIITGSSVKHNESPNKNSESVVKNKPKSRKRISLKKPLALEEKLSRRKKLLSKVKKKSILIDKRPLDNASVELLAPESPSSLGGDETTVILVEENSDIPIISSQRQMTPHIDDPIEDDFPSDVEEDNTNKNFDKTPIEGSYRCQDCPFRTVFRSEIIQHSKKHPKSRIFVCNQCTFSSKFKTGLMEHMLIHENSQPSDSNIKMFKCSQCTFKTSKKSLIVEHERSHFDEKVMMNIMSIKQNRIDTNVKKESIKSKPILPQTHSCANCDFVGPHKASLIVHCTFNCPGNES